MKKIIYGTVFFIVSILCFAGCSKKDETTVSPTTNNTTTEPELDNETDVEGNLVIGGNFSNDLVGWLCMPMAGGSGEMAIVNKALQITVNRTGDSEHSVQVAYDGLKLYNKCRYKVEFDIASSVNREVEFRIQYNGAPYTNYLLNNPSNVVIIETGSEFTHYEFLFTMERQDLAPRLAFNCGKIDEDLEKHTITVDNLVVRLLEGNEEYVDPLNRPKIVVNQVGYYTDAPKTVVFYTEKEGVEFEDEFIIVDSSGDTVGTYALGEPRENVDSRDTVAIGDFSDFKNPGTYTIKAVSGSEVWGESYEFKIGDSLYDDILTDSLMMIYSQRCGCILTEDATAPGYGHDACHLENAVIYESITEDASSRILKDVSGGWHDAGDYGRYVVPAAKTIADLLLSYEFYGHLSGQFKYADGVDEDPTIPDVLEEVRYGLEWMLKMQREDGAVYHKVTSASFPESIMPDDDNSSLIIFPVSNTATADFAAVMAMAYRFYFYDTTFADECLLASQNAYNYLISVDKQKLIESTGFINPAILDENGKKTLKNGYAVRYKDTGEYPDRVCTDEILWMAIELYESTNDSKYLDLFEEYFQELETDTWSAGLGWQEVSFYAMFRYLNCVGTEHSIYQDLYDLYIGQLNEAKVNTEKDIYKSSISGTYPWGSNMTIANNGMLFLLSNFVLEEEDCYDIDLAYSQLEYLLGMNANVYCFVTGYGTLSPEQPHHRPSECAGDAEYPVIKGMLIGGPNNDFANNGGDNVAKGNLEGRPAAKCYIDLQGAWSLNEVTIYWNSPLVCLLLGIINEYTAV